MEPSFGELAYQAQLIHLVRGNEADRLTECACATGAADAMHVILRVEGELVVDDRRERLDVEAARCNVGGDHHARLAGLECGKSAVALLLILVAVNLYHGVSVAMQEVAEAIRLNLTVHEDECLLPRLGAQEVAEQLSSASIINSHDHLANVLVRLVASRNLNGDRIA